MIKRKASNDGIIDRTVIDWYKDAIVYQLHVKAFQDSNNDGVGDLPGLISQLDYIQELGVNTIWLLPFYPSPLRDDGYDIADYKAVNSSYGTMRDFRVFVSEAHRRGLRVITELVINHTSDQHPWFQKARRAKPGSATRDMYVWSDTDTKFPETRIIFTDTEKSNWTWDPVAGAFFWHRFYSHQPDLNFDNPRVLREVLKIMHFWLDMGVDGLRLDAIPYLVEREGTNNENLPETHEVLKRIRADLDSRYSDRMLLAEANQWPEDTRPYFGHGDECHMGFHFPLMPRIYMAVAQEDRHPITDIIRQTPEIPANCQWAIFLRNHDELTLEMVTDKERDYLWRTYAEDPRARINLGIRRRLAPLMQNDRRKIELLNSLLMSMPGTPIVYYGDEIGMGDNYYLGDRDGVRTPMQWTPDRNAGFSRADPQRLFLPAILDPIYGYEAINVESQARDPSSLLNWMRRLISVRKQHAAFARGEMTLLYPRNRKILAYLRESEKGDMLCVANLSRAAQAVELDLTQFKGRVPVELIGQSPFPPVGELPYLITLPGYGFYWFLLAAESEAPKWHQSMPEVLPEFITITSRDGKLSGALSSRDNRAFELEALPKFLPLQRWFGAKDRKIGKVALKLLGELNANCVLAECNLDAGSEKQRYFLPLALRWGEEHVTFGAPKLSYTLARFRRGAQLAAIVDGAMDEEMADQLLAALRGNREITSEDGVVTFRSNRYFAEHDTEEGEPRPLGVDQSNISIAFGDGLVIKLYRRVRAGTQPDVEMARFLTETAEYENTPAYLGSIEYCPAKGEPTTLGAAFAYVANQGSAWDVLLAGIERDVQDFELTPAGIVAGEELETDGNFAFPLNIAPLLGQRTAEMHKALATPTDDPAFGAEPITAGHVADWIKEAETDVDAMFDSLSDLAASLPDELQTKVEELRAQRRRLKSRIAAVGKHKPSGHCSRIHGDYHLGQLLVVQDDLMVVDFEGEPRRSLQERRRKSSPLRDVAGMLRSIDYCAASAMEKVTQPEQPRRPAMERIELWYETFRRDFESAYREHVTGSPTWPDDEAFARKLLDLFLIQKTAYEVSYELANRPTWVGIPLGGLLKLLDPEQSL